MTALWFPDNESLLTSIALPMLCALPACELGGLLAAGNPPWLDAVFPGKSMLGRVAAADSVLPGLEKKTENGVSAALALPALTSEMLDCAPLTAELALRCSVRRFVEPAAGTCFAPATVDF